MKRPGPPTPADADTRLARDAEDLHAALSDLMRIYQLRDRNQICCYDISVTQCHALEALVEAGSVGLGTLAARMHLDKSTTSRVVQALVRKGYAEQVPAATDKRAIVISATRGGRRLHDRITRELVEQQKLVVLDMDPRVRQGVVEVIRRLARSAEARFCGAGSGCEDDVAACCAGTDGDA